MKNASRTWGTWTKDHDVPDWKEIENGLKRCLKKYSLKIVPHFAKTNLQIQEMEQISNRINPKKCVPTHIIVKHLKTEDTKSQKQGQGSTILPMGSDDIRKGESQIDNLSSYVKGPEKKGAKWTQCKQEWILKKRAESRKTVDKNQWNIKLALWKDSKVGKPLTPLTENRRERTHRFLIPGMKQTCRHQEDRTGPAALVYIFDNLDEMHQLLKKHKTPQLTQYGIGYLNRIIKEREFET